MGNAIVYSFHLRAGGIKDLACYKQLRYSIDTLRRFNTDIPVYVYISPSNIDTSALGLGNNVTIIKFSVPIISEDKSFTVVGKDYGRVIGVC